MYLMSNGDPGLLNPDADGKGGDKFVVAYADGHDPHKDADFWVGGDDYGEFLPVEDFEKLLAVSGCTSLLVTVSEDKIVLEAEHEGPKKRGRKRPDA